MGFRNASVAGNRVHMSARLTNLGGNLVQRLFAARIDDDGGAMSGKQARRCAADAG